MCYNCGCRMIQDDMGSADNITESTLAHLSKDWNKSLDETKLEVYNFLNQNLNNQNPSKESKTQVLDEMFAKAAKSWGQSVEEAEANTYKLLKGQLNK